MCIEKENDFMKQVVGRDPTKMLGNRESILRFFLIIIKEVRCNHFFYLTYCYINIFLSVPKYVYFRNH